MSEADKAVVRGYIDEVINKGQGDVSKFEKFVAPDAVLHNPYPAKGTDVAAWKERVRIYVSSFSDIKVTLEDQIAEADKVVTRTIFRGRHTGEFRGIASTGRRIAVDEIQITRLHAGRIVERWSLLDMLGLLQQLGVTLPLK